MSGAPIASGRYGKQKKKNLKFFLRFEHIYNAFIIMNWDKSPNLPLYKVRKENRWLETMAKFD